MSASLNGTMSGMSVMSPEEQAILAQMNAVAQQQQQLLSQSTQAATQQAGQAQQQYQQAAQAPPPDLAALQLLSTLGGGLSEIMGNQGAAERQQQNVQQSRAAMLQARAQNLQALKDVYGQKADEAQRAGDLETTEKYRRQFETLSKQYEIVAANHKRSQAQEDAQTLETQRQANRVALKNTPGAATPKSKEPEEPYDIGPLVTTTASGRQFVDLGSLTGKEKNSAIKAAGERGLIAMGSADATPLKDVDRARRDVDSLWEYVEELLPRDAQGRIATGPNMRIQKILQTNDKRAAFKTYRDVAIPVLRALAGSRGLRITQQQIQLSVDNLPKDTDTYETARRKVEIIRRVLNNAEEPLVNRNWRKQQATAPIQPSQADQDYVKSLGLSP